MERQDRLIMTGLLLCRRYMYVIISEDISLYVVDTAKYFGLILKRSHHAGYSLSFDTYDGSHER